LCKPAGVPGSGGSDPGTGDISHGGWGAGSRGGGVPRMAQTAAHLVDHVIPHMPVRRWVLSVPKLLRPFLHHRPRTATAVLHIQLRALQATPFLIRPARLLQFSPAASRARRPGPLPPARSGPGRPHRPASTGSGVVGSVGQNPPPASHPPPPLPWGLRLQRSPEAAGHGPGPGGQRPLRPEPPGPPPPRGSSLHAGRPRPSYPSSPVPPTPIRSPRSTPCPPRPSSHRGLRTSWGP